MNYKTIFILIFSSSFLFNQEVIGEGLYTNELIYYLNQNYKTNSVLSYGNARDILYSEVDNNNGNVYAIAPNGATEWTFDVGVGIAGTITLAMDGTLYISGSGILFALQLSSTIRLTKFNTPPFLRPGQTS